MREDAAVTIDARLLQAVEAWIAEDPDEGDRAELRDLLDHADGGADGEQAAAELKDRFDGRLTFGTAGLRGAIAAGPNRMNRAVVRGATAAVAGWLQAGAPGWPAGRAPGWPAPAVVVGCDARHRSAEFADEAARVLAAAGISVHVLPLPCPTPLLAFAVRYLMADAGIMITASHNPAADNGYKLYLSDGAQVIPPVDGEIESRIATLGPLTSIDVAESADPRITRRGDEVATAYLDAIVTETAHTARLSVVYTPMHGVAARLMLRAIERAGYAAPHVVKAQADPDPGFPTVAFPNPEEPGALDLALADARNANADLVIANDPDGDRLAVAIPDPAADNGWRALSGDQVGALLGAACLGWTAGPHRLVATSIVSSTLLSAIAADEKAEYREALTGFKWIARSADSTEGARFVFGYEEALGYAVNDVVRDKDGMSAALALLRLATEAKAAGQTLADKYDELEAAHGVHLTARLAPYSHDTDRVMSRLRAERPVVFAGHSVTSMADLSDGADGLPPSDVLVFRLEGARVVMRPSGTEPRIKCYVEVVEQLNGGTLQAARERARARLAPLLAALEELLGQTA
jgi:phosphomannomutase